MKFIKKKDSPEAFENWKNAERPTTWSQLHSKLPRIIEEGVFYYSKEELREALLEEQNLICCYCEMKISNSSITTAIDHIEPREGDTQTERIFDYANLGLSCNGGERDPKPKKSHCDSEKGSKIIPITPYMKKCESEINFDIVGNIFGTTNDAKTTIRFLNLDIPKLNNLRENAIAGYIFLDEKKTEYISPEDGKLLLENLKGKKDLPFQSSILNALKEISIA